MALVERTHGGDKTDDLRGVLATDGAHFVSGVDDLH
jgi:hypothetical protein